MPVSLEAQLKTQFPVPRRAGPVTDGLRRYFKSISEIHETWKGKPISFIKLVSF